MGLGLVRVSVRVVFLGLSVRVVVGSWLESGLPCKIPNRAEFLEFLM